MNKLLLKFISVIAFLYLLWMFVLDMSNLKFMATFGFFFGAGAFYNTLVVLDNSN